MKDFFKDNGIIILVIALLLTLITAVVSFTFGGIANPFANLAGVVATPFRNGIHSVVTWAEGLYSDAIRREGVEAELARCKKRVAELGAQISADYAGKEPMLVSVLRGSYIFMADLTRALSIPCTVDFMAVSSYGSGTTSSGQVNIIKDLSDSIEGKDVIVVEDILDSGNTLSYLFQLLKARNPASLKLCTLLDKPSRRSKPITADYVGFTVPDEFVVGYGLDYDELGRNLNDIYVLDND